MTYQRTADNNREITENIIYNLSTKADNIRKITEHNPLCLINEQLTITKEITKKSQT